MVNIMQTSEEVADVVAELEHQFFEKAADQIIAKRGAVKPRAYVAPEPKPEPEPRPLATTLAGAYRDGFEDASEVAGRCCGCNTYEDGATNPYDGTPL